MLSTFATRRTTLQHHTIWKGEKQPRGFRYTGAVLCLAFALIFLIPGIAFFFIQEGTQIRTAIGCSVMALVLISGGTYLLYKGCKIAAVVKPPVVNEPGICDDTLDAPDSCVTSDFYTNCETPNPEVGIAQDLGYDRPTSNRELTSIVVDTDTCSQLTPPEETGQQGSNNTQLYVPTGEGRSQRTSSLGGIGLQALESPIIQGRIRSVSVTEATS